jgi:hypothetical protein
MPSVGVEVPVIPEADGLWLLLGGLAALGGVAGFRRLRPGNRGRS